MRDRTKSRNDDERTIQDTSIILPRIFLFFFDIGYCFTGKGALWLNDLMDYICFFWKGLLHEKKSTGKMGRFRRN